MNPPLRKLGLYGGTFDPIHNGHLLLARDARERLDLDRIVFLPARVSPHKLDHPPCPAEMRCRMVAEAISGDPEFMMDDMETRREGPSFTIDTVRDYRGRHPEAELFYLIGDDNLPELDTWREIEVLRTMVRFVVLSRAGTPLLSGHPLITRHIEISSTEIRNRIACGLPIRYMVPERVCDLISQHGLYRND